jgi:hypothetical protein
LAEYRLPTVEGRELVIRSCNDGGRPLLQLALISTYGNVMEAVTLEAGDALGLARGAARVARAAHRLHERRCRVEGVLAKERYRDALARNPWLAERREDREQRGLR